jgi:hypothetical protein
LQNSKNYQPAVPELCDTKPGNMATHSTVLLLEKLQQQTERHIQKAIREWQNLSPEVFEQSENTASWNAAQCIEHLNIYGRYYIPAIERAIDRAIYRNSRPSPSFRSSWLGSYFTKLMLPEENGIPKKKMKTPAHARPVASLDTRKVIAEFIDQQEKLMQLMERASKINLNGARVPISIAKFIRLKLGDVFMFIVAHNYRHILQAERALAAAAKDRSTIKSANIPAPGFLHALAQSH